MEHAFENFVQYIATHTEVSVDSVKRCIILNVVRYGQGRPAIVISRDTPRFKSNLLSRGDRDTILRFTSLPGILEDWALHHHMTVHASESVKDNPKTRFPNKEERGLRYMSNNVWYLVMDDDGHGNNGEVVDDNGGEAISTTNNVDGGTNDNVNNNTNDNVNNNTNDNVDGGTTVDGGTNDNVDGGTNDETIDNQREWSGWCMLQ